MRCFLALDLPPPVRNYLAGLTGQFANKGRVKWVPAAQMHLTLVFAGDIDEETADQLREVVRTVELAPLSLHLTGLGHFPPKGEPRVIWAGLGGDVEKLTALQAEVTARAEALGVPPDDRPFVPHVTLGRVKSPFGALALVEQCRTVGASMRDKPFAATALSLYASELRPGGPVHSLLAQRPAPVA